MGITACTTCDRLRAERDELRAQLNREMASADRWRKDFIALFKVMHDVMNDIDVDKRMQLDAALSGVPDVNVSETKESVNADNKTN